jgi:hypothetical protein
MSSSSCPPSDSGVDILIPKGTDGFLFSGERIFYPPSVVRVRGTVTVVTVTDDRWGFGPPIPSTTDDGWGVSLNPSVSVIRRRIGPLCTPLNPRRTKQVVVYCNGENER